MMKKQDYILVISILLVLLWIPVAFEKATDLEAFKAGLVKQPLPEWSIPVLTLLLPFLESTATLLLIPEKTRHYGLWLSLLLTFAFTAYVGIVLGMDKQDRPCVCGSVIRGLTWVQHLIFNSACTLISTTGVILSHKLLHRDRHKGNVTVKGESAKRRYKQHFLFIKNLKK